MKVIITPRHTFAVILIISVLFLLIESVFLKLSNRTYANIAVAVAVLTSFCLAYLVLRHLEQTETEIKVTKALNRGILRSLTYPIAVLDLTGRVISTNAAWSNAGLGNQEDSLAAALKGTNYIELCERIAISGDAIALEASEGIRSVLDDQTPLFKMDYPSHSGDKQIWYNMRVVRFKDVENMIMVSHEDITAAKLEALEKEKMASDIIERNHNLEQFSYIVSHNLRAPLANVLGFVELLDSNLTEDEFYEVKQGMHTAATKLDSVVKDLSYVLRVKTHLFDWHEPVYFHEIVTTVTSTLHDVLHEANVEICTDFKSVEKLSTVKSYMYSIFYTIIFNSIKYKKPGSKTYVEVKSQKIPGGLQLIFKDSGIGIDLTKNKEKLFGLYNRFNANTHGKGVGLFMVKSKVESLGGKISVNSEVGEGTEFIIEFENAI